MKAKKIKTVAIWSRTTRKERVLGGIIIRQVFGYCTNVKDFRSVSVSQRCFACSDYDPEILDVEIVNKFGKSYYSDLYKGDVSRTLWNYINKPTVKCYLGRKKVVNVKRYVITL